MSARFVGRDWTDLRTGTTYRVLEDAAENTGDGLFPSVYIGVSADECDVEDGARVSREVLAAWAKAILSELEGIES